MAGSDAADEKRLAQLGLQQVFKRELNYYTNFAITFSVMCVPGTITSKSSIACSTSSSKEASASPTLVLLALQSEASF